MKGNETFVYDNYNYAKYLTPMLGTMLDLENTHPFTFNHFKQGLFTAQLTEGQNFTRIEPDKVIEMTVNKDSKGRGGFSRNEGAVHRWELNASYRAALRRCLHEHTNYKKASFEHSDLTASRIKKDRKDVANIISLLNDTLVSISSGISIPPEFVDEIMSAKMIGTGLMEQFIRERLLEERNISLFDKIKKRNIFSFSKLVKHSKNRIKDREVILTADKNLFGKISIIMQKRIIDLKTIFCYPLGPLPWSLCSPLGNLKKNNKASLLHKLEGPVIPTSLNDDDNACVIDGMALVRQSKVSDLTFGLLARQLLKTVLTISESSSRVDVVFDRYNRHSIKNTERERRAKNELVFKNIISTNPIKQWNQFLSNGQNKEQLINFICDQWKQSELLQLIGDKMFYVTSINQCYRLFNNQSSVVSDLECCHKEADTRLLLHAKHASNEYNHIVIYTPDTDVFVIALAMKQDIDSNI